MKTLVNKINEQMLSNWNMTNDQILAVYSVLCLADAQGKFEAIAKTIGIDKYVLDELKEDFGDVVNDNIKPEKNICDEISKL